jgi:hypothetical protein
LLAAWGLAADPGNPATTTIAYLIIFIGYMSFFVMFMRYEVVAFRYIWSNRGLGEASFQNDIAPGKIIGVYVIGTLLVAIFTLLVSAAMVAAIIAVGYFVQGADLMAQLEQLQAMNEGGGLSGDQMQSLPGLVMAAAFFYITLFAFPFAFSQIFITRPILQRKAEAMVIHGAQVLTQSRQRAHDHAAEAGGFADALGVDVGAGF